MLDDFEDLSGWSVVADEGARVSIAQDAGRAGGGMRVDFDFRNGGRYVVVRKRFPIALPESYVFSFDLRADAAANDFEFKLVDDSGENVWWRNRRSFEFPREWRRLSVKKRDVKLAWGVAGDGVLNSVGAEEFALSPDVGGKGSIWIDELRIEPRASSTPYTLTPQARASATAPYQDPGFILDEDPNTSWASGVVADEQWLAVDFLRQREYGGAVIDWDPHDYATTYDVEASDDEVRWTLIHTVTAGNGGRDYIYAPEAESRHLRLKLRRSSRGRGYRVRTVSVKLIEFSASINHFFEAIAKDATWGSFPKYLHRELTYWTVVGADGDDKEALLNEEGMLEVDKRAFSIEPFLYVDGRLVTWASVDPVQLLEQAYLPIPSVLWQHDQLALKVTAYVTGEPGESVLYARYRIENLGAEGRRLKLFLAIRPLQVNPPWQSLNMVGGASRLHDLAYTGRVVTVNQQKLVFPLTTPARFGAITFDQGPLSDFLAAGEVPASTHVSDPFGYASGMLEYQLALAPGAIRDLYVAVPFHDARRFQALVEQAGGAAALGDQQLEAARRYWRTRLDRVDIELPPNGQKITDTLKSTLAHILINRDGHTLQPGSRCYERSWIRDGALTSTALLAMGYTEEVREFIEWYARYQAPNGLIPCCVDTKGAATVLENDSNGEFIYLVMEYYRYRGDLDFLRQLWPAAKKAVEYIDVLRRQRTTEAYSSEDLRPFYGLMPESISHEGYRDRPVHSYWDNFFVLRGLKDAAAMAVAIGHDGDAVRFAKLRDEFRNDLYVSLERAQQRHNITFIPGSVEYGDFDPTATTIALSPGGELTNLPEASLRRTFEDYYDNFLRRRSGEIERDAYAPYEVRIVETFVRLGRRRRALELLEFLLADRRPIAWNQWPEVVWRDPKASKFIGDMPHTWVGSDYLRAVRSLFAFERESDQALVIAAGLPGEWLASEDGVTIKRFPTYYGGLNYNLRQEGPGRLRLRLSGDLALPPGGVVIKPPITGPLKAVTVDGQPIESFDENSATIRKAPADVVLRY